MSKNYAFLVFFLLGNYALTVPQAHAGNPSGGKNTVHVPAGAAETFSPLEGAFDIRWFSIPHMPPETVAASRLQQNSICTTYLREKYLASPSQNEIFRHPPGPNDTE